jgi:hypothetical protein
MVAAAAVALIGGVTVGSAQAQVVPRHGIVAPQAAPLGGPPDWGVHAAPPGRPWPVAAAATASDTRDMGVQAHPNGVATPKYETCTVITADGVNIRRSPWGTVIGTAYHTDKVSDRISAEWDPAGNEWIQLVDYTRGNILGYVFGAYVSENNTPWWQCP